MTDHDLGGSLDGWDDELNDWTEDDRVTASLDEGEAALIAADHCIRPDTTGAQSCRQGYDHTGHCDWWSSPAVTDVLAGIQPNPRIERAQAAYNAALLDELPPMVVDWEAERRAGLVDRSHHDD